MKKLSILLGLLIAVQGCASVAPPAPGVDSLDESALIARSRQMWRVVMMRRLAPYLAAQYPGLREKLVFVTDVDSGAGAPDCQPNTGDVRIPFLMLRGFRMLADAVTFVTLHPEHEALFEPYAHYLRSIYLEDVAYPVGPIPVTFDLFAKIRPIEFQRALAHPHAASLRNDIELDAFAVATAQKIGLVATRSPGDVGSAVCTQRQIRSADEFAFDATHATQRSAALGRWSSFAMFLVFDAAPQPDEAGASSLHCRAAFFYRREARSQDRRVDASVTDVSVPTGRPPGLQAFSDVGHCPP
jgi:hypothetical protein